MGTALAPAPGTGRDVVGDRACLLLGLPQEPPLHPQVSHHPPVSAFHVSNRKDGFCISGSITAKSRFYGEGGSPGPRGNGGRTDLPHSVVTETSPGGHVRVPLRLS